MKPSSGRTGTATAVTRLERTKVLIDTLTGKERTVISFQVLRGMMIESTDKLPTPAEFRCMIGKGKKQKLVRLKKTWIGFGWHDNGEADGTEPLLVVEDEDFQVMAVHGS